MIKSSFYKILFCLVLLLPVKSLFALEFMDIEDVKPGMKGEAYTVFYGFKQEKFQVEILGLIKNMEPSKTTILAKFSGENIEKTGIAQGMSGSPVYIDGKLVGAVAFTWGFLREPIGGIQPISQMLPVLEQPKQEVRLKAQGNLEVKDLYVPMLPLDSKAPEQLKNIGVPLVLSGFSGQGFSYASKYFQSKGVRVVDAAGGGDAGAFEDNPEDMEGLKAGDAVGILLMSGDSNASAIGTVTYVDENDPKKVLIFGHPFQGLGYVDLPMTRAAVQYTMPIMELPFKMATPTNIIGTIYNDRSTAVAGVIGKSPLMVPVDVKLMDQRQNNVYSFHYNIVPDPSFFPKLLSGAIISSFNRYQESKPQTVQFEYNLYIKDLKTGKEDIIQVKDYIIGAAEEVPKAIATYVDAPLNNLMYNFYGQAQIQRVEVKLSYLQNLQVARLSQVIIPKNSLKPGETTDIKVYIETFQNKKEVITIPFTVPYNYSETALPISISGGSIERQNYEKMYVGIKDPKNYQQLVQALSLDNLSNEIAVYYDVKGITANVGGYTLKDLPLSKAMDYGVKLQGDKYFGALREKQSYKTNYFIVGDLKTYIMIKDTKVKV